MSISTEVRNVEDEIDERVRAMPLWRCAREPVVRASLDYYRNAVEIFMLGMSWAAIQEDEDRTRLIETVPLVENRVRAGVFYVLKWALMLCPSQSTEVFDYQLACTGRARWWGARSGHAPGTGRRRWILSSR